MKALLWALCLVVLALAAAMGLARYGSQIPVVGPLIEATGNDDTVVQGVQRLNELATAEMTAQVVVTQQQEDVHIFFPGVRVPDWVSGETVLLVARGEVKAGVNLDELGKHDIHVQGKKVRIELPEARVLETTLNEEKTELHVLQRGVLTRGDYTLVERARRESLDKIEAAARDEDIVEQAQNNAEDSIREFLTSLGYEKVVFTY